MRRLLRWTALLMTFPMALWAQDSEPEESTWGFGFEGEVQRVDEVLNAQVESGERLAGYFVFADAPAKSRLGAAHVRFEDALQAGDFTIGENYVIVYSGEYDDGPGHAEVFNDAAREFEDLFSVAIPLASAPIGVSGHRAKWLELWFYDTSGDMLDGLELPDSAFAFEDAWFRLSFYVEEKDKPAVIEGNLTRLERIRVGLDPEQETRVLESFVLDLANQLRSKQRELDKVREQVTSLTARIDELETENERLRQELEDQSDPVEMKALREELTARGRVVDTLAKENATLRSEKADLENVLERVRTRIEEDQTTSSPEKPETPKPARREVAGPPMPVVSTPEPKPEEDRFSPRRARRFR